MESLISIIIPVYNVALYLREALDSVINQTYKNLEIIIVDDGSTDESGLICDEYTFDPRVKVIHQENQGLSGARNTGLDIMQGEYVSFLDPDDAFRPEMLQIMLDAIQKYDADLAVCGYSTCWTEGRLDNKNNNKKNYYNDKVELFDSIDAQRRILAGRMNVVVWNKLYKKYLWDNLRFPVGHVYEDLRVIFYILEKANSVLTIPEVLVYHRKRKGSITATNTGKNNYDCFISHKKKLNYVETHTPAVFSSKDVIMCREQLARILTIRYGECIYRKQCSHEKYICKKEAVSQWNALKGEKIGFKLKITYVLFKYAPFLIFPARKLWQFIKRISGKRI